MKKPSWLSEFKEFISKGDVMSLAVGVIIGGAFSTITSSLTNDIIMPVVSMFLGGVDFSQWKITLPQLFGEVAEDAVPITLNYGNFISTVINFLILAFVVFWMVKAFNRTKRKKPEAPSAPPAPPEPSAEEKLLTEIRDLLKKNNDR